MGFNSAFKGLSAFVRNSVAIFISVKKSGCCHGTIDTNNYTFVAKQTAHSKSASIFILCLTDNTSCVGDDVAVSSSPRTLYRYVIPQAKNQCRNDRGIF
jgi:hypothetical protein